MPPIHSDLPIITPEGPRRSQVEKYGGLFYLGIGGLALLVVVIGLFAYGLWGLGPVLTNVYVVNDPTRPEPERIGAAWALARDPSLTQRQAYDLALSRVPPPLARAVLAEALTVEAVEPDPRGFALAVARSEGWPDWLRLMLVRPLALAADAGLALPTDVMGEVAGNRDPFVAAWADFALAVRPEGDDPARARLRALAEAAGPEAELARRLLAALGAARVTRAELLEEATRWQRHHHPGLAALWAGWAERDGRLVAEGEPARNLQRAGP